MVEFMSSISNPTNGHSMQAKLESRFFEVFKNLIFVVLYFAFWLKTY